MSNNLSVFPGNFWFELWLRKQLEKWKNLSNSLENDSILFKCRVNV